MNKKHKLHSGNQKVDKQEEKIKSILSMEEAVGS